MNQKKAMLNNSHRECGWNLALNGVALVVLIITACYDECFPFYCAALVQGLSNLAPYIEVGKKSHKKLAFVTSIFIKIFAGMAMMICLAYIILSSQMPSEGTHGYTVFGLLDTFCCCMITVLLLAAPFFEGCFEYFYYVFSNREDIY